MSKADSVIRYEENAAIDAEVLTRLYHSLGWTAYSSDKEKMGKLLSGSLWHVSAWDKELLVGLIRCVGDGCSILYIQDLLVREAYQRQGIGSHLLRTALSRFSHIRQIVLLTQDEEKTKAFYTAQGMVTPENIGAVCFLQMNTS